MLLILQRQGEIQVLTATSMKMNFWDVAPCGPFRVIALMMEEVSSSETPASTIRLHGETSQKTETSYNRNVETVLTL
jgi:hypothetical protein